MKQSCMHSSGPHRALQARVLCKSQICCDGTQGAIHDAQVVAKGKGAHGSNHHAADYRTQGDIDGLIL